MTEIRVNYELSEAGRKALFEATGNWPRNQQELKVNAADLPSEMRATLFDQNQQPWVDKPAEYDWYVVWLRNFDADEKGNSREYVGRAPLFAFDAAPTWEQTHALLLAMPERHAVWLTRCEVAKERERIADEQSKAASDAKRAAERAKEDERDRQKAAEQAAAEAKRLAIAADRLAWATAHGSDQLRRGMERGHDCGRLYVIERAAVEAAGYVVDYEDSAKWKQRSCPSTAALDEADRVQALGLGLVEIVWLTDPAQDRKLSEADDEYNYYNPFEPCEAVVVREYLDRYVLVKIIS